VNVLQHGGPLLAYHHLHQSIDLYGALLNLVNRVYVAREVAYGVHIVHNVQPVQAPVMLMKSLQTCGKSCIDLRIGTCLLLSAIQEV
jgi:hypothetical protein